MTELCRLRSDLFLAALFQAIYNYIKNPNAGFHFGDGITFLGGLIGGAACFICVYFIFRKKFNMRLYQVLSILPCCILIAHAFGRVGCFFAGCCYGKETNGFWGVEFPNLSSKVYPTQLFEAVFLLIMFYNLLLSCFAKKFQIQYEPLSDILWHIQIFHRTFAW